MWLLSFSGSLKVESKMDNETKKTRVQVPYGYRLRWLISKGKSNQFVY
ncbi:hypothetical protein ACKLNO_09390 [Neisseriaceae bacterium B1]